MEGSSSIAPVQDQLEYVLKAAGARLISALGISALAFGRKFKKAYVASPRVASTECRSRASAFGVAETFNPIWTFAITHRRARAGTRLSQETFDPVTLECRIWCVGLLSFCEVLSTVPVGTLSVADTS